MKIGLRKPLMDLSIKHIGFEIDGKEHYITFRFSHRKGITDVVFDSKPVKITSAYPPLLDVLKKCALVIWLDFRSLCITVYRMFARKKQGRNQSDQK